MKTTLRNKCSEIKRVTDYTKVPAESVEETIAHHNEKLDPARFSCWGTRAPVN